MPLQSETVAVGTVFALPVPILVTVTLFPQKGVEGMLATLLFDKVQHTVAPVGIVFNV